LLLALTVESMAALAGKKRSTMPPVTLRLEASHALPIAELLAMHFADAHGWCILAPRAGASPYCWLIANSE
jgi:hypothetical protein